MPCILGDKLLGHQKPMFMDLSECRDWQLNDRRELRLLLGWKRRRLCFVFFCSSVQEAAAILFTWWPKAQYPCFCNATAKVLLKELGGGHVSYLTCWARGWDGSQSLLYPSDIVLVSCPNSIKDLLPKPGPGRARQKWKWVVPLLAPKQQMLTLILSARPRSEKVFYPLRRQCALPSISSGNSLLQI